jgi:hypothetical protein
MKKVFEIECPDNIGEVWLDSTTIYSALQDHPHLNEMMVVDISEEISKMRSVISALFNESDTRVPKGFDQKSEDYALRVSAHNDALMELARVLNDVGYRE